MNDPSPSAVTPGTPLPWARGGTVIGSCTENGMQRHIVGLCWIADDQGDKDAAYIVHACNEYPVLIAHIATLETTIARLSEALRPFAFVAKTEERAVANERVMVNVNRCRDAQAAITAYEQSRLQPEETK